MTTSKKESLLVALILILVCLSFMGCKTTETQPTVVTKVKVDTTYVNKLVRDSIFVQDSVFVREKGDTVVIEKTRYKYVNVLRTDTFLSVKVDSIPVPYPVEKKLTKWQSVKVSYGGKAMALLAALFAGVLVYLGLKLKRWFI